MNALLTCFCDNDYRAPLLLALSKSEAGHLISFQLQLGTLLHFAQCQKEQRTTDIPNRTCMKCMYTGLTCYDNMHLARILTSTHATSELGLQLISGVAAGKRLGAACSSVVHEFRHQFLFWPTGTSAMMPLHIGGKSR